jgi:hypothetical protein
MTKPQSELGLADCWHFLKLKKIPLRYVVHIHNLFNLFSVVHALMVLAFPSHLSGKNAVFHLFSVANLMNFVHICFQLCTNGT